MHLICCPNGVGNRRISRMWHQQLLNQFKDILIVATGAPSERDYVQKVVDMAANPRFVNSAGVFKFNELVPLYSVSTFMLTNDSGPAHFASVTPLESFCAFWT